MADRNARMLVRHNDPELEQAENDPNYRGELDSKLVRDLRKTLNMVRNYVRNESQFRFYPGLNFEPLKGKRCHQHSMRLNDQMRLIVEIEKRPGPNNNVCVVIGIEKHYEGKTR